MKNSLLTSSLRLYYILLLLSFFMAKAGSAQNSGFMGKKLLISGAAEANTNWLFLSTNLSGDASIKDFLNLKNAFSLEYTCSRKIMLGLYGSYNRFASVAIAEKYYEPSWSTPYIDDEQETYQFNVLNLGAGIKFFSKNSIAPFGTYREIQIGAMKSEFIDINGVYTPKGTVIEKISDVYIGFGLGRQQLIFKNIFINLGANLKFYTLMRDGKYIAHIKTYQDTHGNDLTLRYFPGSKVLESYVLNAKAGLGFMIF